MGSRPVLMLTLDWRRDHDGRRNLGAASIVAALEGEGVQVRWLEDAVNDPSFDLATFLERAVVAASELGRRGLVAIGCYVWNEPHVQALLEALAPLGVDVVLGGPQISFTDKGEPVELYRGVRYFVRGYGERAMVALATDTAVNGRDGLWDTREVDLGVRSNGSLTELPSPYLTGVVAIGREVRWETQRGCPYRCSFCQHREPTRKHQLRALGEERLDRELALFAASGVERISILDPIFHVKVDRAVAILRRARQLGVTARISMQCRLEQMTERFLDAVEDLDVTLEFGLQTVHASESKAVKRQNRMDKAEPWLREIVRRGIDFEVSLIYGLPLQTLESFCTSVQWNLERGVPRVVAWPLMLLRGTPIYAERERWGFIESDGAIPEVVASHTFNTLEHEAMRLVADWLRANPGARSLPAAWLRQGAA